MIVFYKFKQFCRILIIVILKIKMTKNSILQIICLTSLTRAKPKEKMEFPA